MNIDKQQPIFRIVYSVFGVEILFIVIIFISKVRYNNVDRFTISWKKCGTSYILSYVVLFDN